MQTRQLPPESDRPLAGYAATMTVYGVLTGGFVAWFGASGRKLPERVDPYDLALVTAATHKGARMVTKDRIAEPVRAPFEDARGRGLRRALGELLTCPYCLSVWIATALTAGMVVAPRPTRQFAAVLTAVFGADLLQQGYARLSR